MTYAVNGLIQATDYNGLVSTNSTNVNAFWATGSGNRGYGQTALATVSSNSIIFSSSWTNLINTIVAAANHQGSTLSAWTDSTPNSNELIRFETNMSANINTADTNRLNAASQGSTSVTTVTSASTWNASITFTFTVTFANDNSARYFFNAGGQIGFTFSHPAGAVYDIDQLISDLCSDAGTLWFSAPNSGAITLAGTSYNGVTKFGGQSASVTTVYTNNGFYSIYSSGTNTLLTQYSNFYYFPYESTYLQVSASYNGAGVLTFTCLFDEVPDGATVSTGTVANLTVRPPSTTYLANSWGTPSVIGSTSTSSIPPVANFTANVTSGTEPLTVNFTDLSSNTPTSWAWDFTNDGIVDSTAQNPSYTYSSAGTYTVKLTATNSAGSDIEIKTNYITVAAAPAPPCATPVIGAPV